jgi:hypothetical protein
MIATPRGQFNDKTDGGEQNRGARVFLTLVAADCILRPVETAQASEVAE